jgi:hypothetical protein
MDSRFSEYSHNRFNVFGDHHTGESFEYNNCAYTLMFDSAQHKWCGTTRPLVKVSPCGHPARRIQSCRPASRRLSTRCGSVDWGVGKHSNERSDGKAAFWLHFMTFGSPKFAAAQNWPSSFWGESFGIVSDAFSPRSQLLWIKWNNYIFFSSNLDCWYLRSPH